ncbi:MAG TPA: MFS transporter [Alphaproteobacteria bacterium]|nr:MFS transporter [Alphaproteobacteria bacterium]
MSDQSVGTHSTIKGFHEWMTVAVMLSGGLMMAIVVSAMTPVAHEAAAYFAAKGGQDDLVARLITALAGLLSANGAQHGDLVAQMIMTMPALGIILGGPLCGWLIDRMGSKPFLLTILAVYGVSGSAGLYLDSATGLMVSRFVLGLATAGSMTAMITSIAEYFSPEARARILGYQSATGSFAGVLMIKLAGWLGDYGGWRLPFALYLLSFAVLLLGIKYLPASKPRARATSIKTERRGSIWGLWPVYLLIVPMFVAVYMPNIQVSFLLRDDGIVQPSTQSNIILTGAFMVGLTALFYGRFRPHLSGNTILYLCFLSQGAGITIMGLSHSAIPIAGGCAILGIGTGIANPLIADLIVARAAPAIRARAIGASYTMRYVGDLANPFIIWPLAFAVGLHNAFVGVGVLFLASVLAFAGWRQLPTGRKAAETAAE